VIVLPFVLTIYTSNSLVQFSNKAYNYTLHNQMHFQECAIGKFEICKYRNLAVNQFSRNLQVMEFVSKDNRYESASKGI